MKLKCELKIHRHLEFGHHTVLQSDITKRTDMRPVFMPRHSADKRPLSFLAGLKPFQRVAILL